jgi:REP element-mobilizing transposase RayT
MEWLPVFTKTETVQILLDCWQYQRQHAGLKLYGYVILENHLHFIAQSNDLNKSVSGFKSYTARKIIDHLEAHHIERLLGRLHFAKLAHRTDREYQLWQVGVQALLARTSKACTPAIGTMKQ